MYSNLKAEMARNNVTSKDVAIALGKSPSAISAKMTGNANFTLDEAVRIKQLLRVDLPIDELFAE